MKIANFLAAADIVGRRVRVSWDFVLEDSETLADVPAVTVRRKLRDFQFPPPAPGAADVVYDSGSFPPASAPPAVSVIDLPDWETFEGATRTVVEGVSVARTLDGRMVEFTRRTVSTTTGADGKPIRRRVEILDQGGAPGQLEPGTTYYYQLFSPAIPPDSDPGPYRATAMVTERFGLNRWLYNALPQILRRHDVLRLEEKPWSRIVPEASPESGQLRRFIDLFGTAADSLRSTAEGLRGLHDIDHVDYRFLPLLARGIGWNLSFDVDIPLQRNELKSASRLYRVVGTVPGLRATVSRYTGWHTQVAEFAQNILRTNRPCQLNVFAVEQTPDGWRGTDDAAVLLGFPASNSQAAGSTGVAAQLVGIHPGPFRLRPGMELRLGVDQHVPATVRFGPADFADWGAATAAEVAAAINRTMFELTAGVTPGGQLELVSKSAGPESSLRVLPSPPSLVTLEGAQSGRLSVLIDQRQRLRLFYETSEAPVEPGSRHPATASGTMPLRPEADEVQAVAQPRGRVKYKTLVHGSWRNSHPPTAVPSCPEGNPTALELPDGRIWLAWIDRPHGQTARLRFRLGASRQEQPARLVGRSREPFTLVVGATLTLVGHWPGPETFIVQSADFVDPGQATAVEVAAAISAQLSHVSATAESNGALRLETTEAGPHAHLAIDLRSSNTARRLGFDPPNAAAAGQWDDQIDWTAPRDVLSVRCGRHADLHAAADPHGGVRLFWSTHYHRLWRITSARWDEQTWLATAAGVSVRSAMGGWTTYTTADGLADNDVRAVALDADGIAWFATASGVSCRRPNGSWTTFTTADGLAHNDVRSVALGPDGSAWFATPAGVSRREPDGTWTTFGTAAGLPSNDVRAVGVSAEGHVWLATGAGAAQRSASGQWTAFTIADGPARNDVRDVAVAADGAIWFATADGVARRRADGNWSVFGPSHGLPSSDVWAIEVDPEGSVWAGTSAGVGLRARDPQWTQFTTDQGLASNEVRALSLGPDGSVWVGTPAGVSVRQATGAWVTFTSADGLAGDDVQGIHGPWSAPRELAQGSGGNREPFAVTDATGHMWLLWSERQGIGTPEDVWLLRYRRYDPAALAWDPEGTLTVAPLGGRAADREPAALPEPGPGGGLRVFFRSDRGGGQGVWSMDVSPSGAAGALVPPAAEPANNSAPAPIRLGDGSLWVLHRSDRNVALGEIGPEPSAGNPAARSCRVAAPGALRRFAGSTSVVPADVVRAAERRAWGDLLAYTAQRPDGLGAASPDGEVLYTRGTVGLYVSRLPGGAPLSQSSIHRLRQLIEQFLPINVRVVVILVPSVHTEYVYPAGSDIQESYQDRYPEVETYTGLSDSSVVIIDWRTLKSNTLTDTSAEVLNPASMRARSWFPPLS